MAIFFLPLAACAQTPSTTAASPPTLSRPIHSTPAAPPKSSCTASTSGGLIGQSHTVLYTMRFSKPIRILWPNTPATMDFSPNRVNFILDKQGIIRAIRCG